MAYADDTATLVKWVKLYEEEIKNARSATENTMTNAAALLADIDTLSTGEQAALITAVQARLAQQRGIVANAKEALLPILSRIGRTIGSNTAQGETIIDLKRFFEDWRDYQDGAADEKVVARAVSYASEPAASDNGNVKRLTLGINGAGDVMECGRHNATVTAEVISKPSPFRAVSQLRGPQGPFDALNVYAGPSTTKDIEHNNEQNLSSNVSNPGMGQTNTTTNDAAVTSIGSWTLATTLGSPSLLIDTTAAKLFRSRALSTSPQQYHFSISGASSTKTFTQRIPAGVMENRRTPILPYMPFYLNAGWAGTITIAWGSKSQAFTEADLTAGAWVNLFVDRDADLYPEVFDTDDASYTITIATGAGAGSNELAFCLFDAPTGTFWNGNWYWIISNDDEPTLGSTLTFADTATTGGEIQDTIAMCFDDEPEVGAYLMTAGSNVLADPA